MILKKQRLQKGWSQELLSEFSGVSVRTIQRLECGKNASAESLKCLAAVFETDISSLQGKDEIINNQTKNSPNLNNDQREATEYVKNLKSFYTHLGSYLDVIIILFLVNFFTDYSYMWAFWPAIGWGVGIAIRGLEVFEIFYLFDPKWEKKQIEKRLRSSIN